jgi:hypothetical protein
MVVVDYTPKDLQSDILDDSKAEDREKDPRIHIVGVVVVVVVDDHNSHQVVAEVDPNRYDPHESKSSLEEGWYFVCFFNTNVRKQSSHESIVSMSRSILER